MALLSTFLSLYEALKWFTIEANNFDTDVYFLERFTHFSATVNTFGSTALIKVNGVVGPKQLQNQGCNLKFSSYEQALHIILMSIFSNDAIFQQE